MKYCPNCNSALDDNAAQCHICGLVYQQYYQQYPQQYYQQQAYAQQQYMNNGQVAATNIAATKKKKHTGIIIVLLLIVVGVIAFFKFGNNIIPLSKIVTPEEYCKSAAMDIVKEQLKAPSTVRWHEVKFLEEDEYGRVLVYLDYEAQNSFGGYGKDKVLVVIQEYDQEKGNYSYNRITGCSKLENGFDYDLQVDLAKSLNKWGKPRESTENQ